MGGGALDSKSPGTVQMGPPGPAGQHSALGEPATDRSPEAGPDRISLSGFFKWLQSLEGVQRSVSRLVTAYLDFVFRTSSWSFHGFESRDRRLAEGELFFGAFWHCHLALIPFIWPATRHPASAVVSDHPDANILVRVLNKYGIGSVRVPTSKFTLATTRRILKRMKDGHCIAICPDGPVGPRHSFKIETMELAKLTDSRICLIAWAVKRRILMPSWDRFVLPLPFNRGVFIWDAGIVVPRSASGDEMEHLRADVERRLSELGRAAERKLAEIETSGRGSYVPAKSSSAGAQARPARSDQI